MGLISKRPCFFYGHKNGVQGLAIDNKICKGIIKTYNLSGYAGNKAGAT